MLPSSSAIAPGEVLRMPAWLWKAAVKGICVCVLGAALWSAASAEMRPTSEDAADLCEALRVQDRYAGDVGDFMKLGLLRHLAASP
jgi:hypothetical protein